VHLLLVEDEETDYLVARAILEKLDRPRVVVDRAATYREALRALDGDYDVCLVDYVLPDGDGLELLKRAAERGIRTPIIMLTGKGSREVDLEAMKAGAADYLVKGSIEPALMERSIRYALERRRSAEALRASEERVRTLFERLPLGLYRITPDGEFLDANPALIRILGSPDRETLRKVYSPQLYVTEGDQARFRERLESEGVVVGFETSLRKGDGSIIHVRNSARLHRGPTGEVEYIEGAIEDATELARVRRVVDSEAHYRAVAAGSSVGILIMDLDGTVLEANRAAGDVFGCPSEDLEGRNVTVLFADQDRQGVTADVSSLRQQGAGRVAADRRLRRIDGALLRVRVCLTSVLDPSGHPFHLVCLLEDIAGSSETAASEVPETPGV
jgi:PAS domain S-box-containing protein